MEHLRLQVLFIIKAPGQFKESKKVWDNSLLCPKKSNGFAVAFSHGCDSLGKIELPNKPFRKAIPCIFTITQIKQLYH